MQLELFPEKSLDQLVSTYAWPTLSALSRNDVDTVVLLAAASSDEELLCHVLDAVSSQAGSGRVLVRQPHSAVALGYRAGAAYRKLLRPHVSEPDADFEGLTAERWRRQRLQSAGVVVDSLMRDVPVCGWNEVTLASCVGVFAALNTDFPDAPDDTSFRIQLLSAVARRVSAQCLSPDQRGWFPEDATGGKTA